MWLAEGGQRIAAAARALGVVEQTLFNWGKAQRQGKLSNNLFRSCMYATAQTGSVPDGILPSVLADHVVPQPTHRGAPVI